MLLLQLFLVLACIVAGARLGGIGLGVMGGLGVALLTFVFGLQPTSPPVDVMLMIAAVIAAASCMQAAGGLDYMVKVAEHLLRKHPQNITILAPLVTYTFTFLAGTGHVAYSVLPVISEVARETKIRPERPLGIAVIASQQAITASPISAATVALLGMLAGFDITLFDILKVSVPATLIGVLVGAFFSMRVGKELVDDPEYKRRVAAGLVYKSRVQAADVQSLVKAKVSVALFFVATLVVVFFGSIEKLRPSFDNEVYVEQKVNATVETVDVDEALLDEVAVNAAADEAAANAADEVESGEKLYFKSVEKKRLGMPFIIEMVMLATAALILLLTKTDGVKAVKGSVFSAGMQAVVAIFGIAWMGDTFINGNIIELKGAVESAVNDMPWLFGLALFAMSILLYSQAATVRAIVPLGIALAISPMMLIALFPAVNGYFFIPNYPTLVAAINFDSTGTTRIGKWVLNHSFMLPGLISTAVAVAVGLLLIQVY